MLALVSVWEEYNTGNTAMIVVLRGLLTGYYGNRHLEIDGGVVTAVEPD
jgi:hypothetical protein